MRKADAIIVAVGAIIVLVAAGVAARSDGPRGAFLVTFPTQEHAVALPAASPLARYATVFNVSETNVARANATATFTSATPFPPGTTAHLRLVAPNGSASEEDAGPTAGAFSFSVSLVAQVAPIPAALDLAATREGDARVAGNAWNSTAGRGDWTLEVSFSGGPSPALGSAPGVTQTVAFGWASWSPHVELRSSPAK